MDAEELLQALSTEETHELVAALSIDVLRAETIRRGIKVPTTVGVTATQAAAVKIETTKSEFETSVGNFLDPEACKKWHTATMGDGFRGQVTRAL